VSLCPAAVTTDQWVVTNAGRRDGSTFADTVSSEPACVDVLIASNLVGALTLSGATDAASHGLPVGLGAGEGRC
jgi:hypothetical protein